MSAAPTSQITTAELVKCLSDPNTYPGVERVSIKETHLSWVFLAGPYAFKVKKPIKTSFVDYTSLTNRERFCLDEVRLNRRYAENLYIGVVPIVATSSGVAVEKSGQAIEYAVKMHRFPEDALLSESLRQAKLSIDDVRQLATTIAVFHGDAPRATVGQPWGIPESVFKSANDNFCDLYPLVPQDAAKTLHYLQGWTSTYFGDHCGEFSQRLANGFVRECHGDLHLANIVQFDGHLIPFDGIEFNDQFRWIDVLSDAAFVGMDFAARDHLELSRSFINCYLEQTGDHASPSVLRWYLVYRALVRAKVAAIRSRQAKADCSESMRMCGNYIDLAYRFSLRQQPSLWITHGVSGSGKTTASEQIVQQTGAIRLRSDIERKRHFGLAYSTRVSDRIKAKIYCETANHATYDRLKRLATGILRAGYPVVVDATFLQRKERTRFHDLAEHEGASFRILDCDADLPTLRRRITGRSKLGLDASDADLDVLQRQWQTRQPLAKSEQKYVTQAANLKRKGIEQ